jgi:polar amino acid transport system substrate-binding protein
MSRRFSMDRRSYLKVAGVASTAGLAGCLSSFGGGNGGELVPATAPGFPPFEMKDGGELVGFDVDLLTAVVAESDYELGEWKEFEFSSLIPALSNGRVDVVAAAMTINDERDETIDFTDPYYNADQAILVREGGSFSPSALADLSDHPVGAQEGTTGASVVKSELVEGGDMPESNFNTYGSYVLAVEDLVNENLDAVVVDTPVANTFEAQRPVSIAFTYETGERYGFGVQEGADDVTSALNDGLAAVQDSGEYEEIRNEWFSEA